MLGFFIVIFGIFYYIMLYITEKLQKLTVDNAHKNHMSVYDQFLSKYGADREYARTIEKYVKSGEHADAIREELSDDFKFIYGENWAKETISLKCTGKENETLSIAKVLFPKHIAYHLLLAREGKIDSYLFHLGHTILAFECKEKDIKFAQCLERRLHEAGAADAELVLVDDSVISGNVFRKIIFSVKAGGQRHIRVNDPFIQKWMKRETFAL